MSNAFEPIVDGRSPRSLAFACRPRLCVGTIARNRVVGFRYGCALYRIALREVSVVDYLMIWPALCLAWPCLRWRGDGRVANVSGQEQDRRPRWRKLYVEMSVAIGLAYGLIATGLKLLWRGWLGLPGAVVINMTLFPFLGLVVGLRLTGPAGEPRWSWRFMRFSMRTMLLLIAYLSLLRGLGVVAARIGVPAHRFFGSICRPVESRMC